MKTAELWDAINEYAESCGATPGSQVYGNTKRQQAVAEIEAIALGLYRSGMEQAANICESANDTYGAYYCAELINESAKTAQLP